MMDDSSVTLQELEKATHIAAGLVRRQGDVYWPIFERLDRELRARRKRHDRLEAYQ